jgi:hypothetical protein
MIRTVSHSAQRWDCLRITRAVKSGNHASCVGASILQTSGIASARLWTSQAVLSSWAETQQLLASPAAPRLALVSPGSFLDNHLPARVR